MFLSSAKEINNKISEGSYDLSNEVKYINLNKSCGIKKNSVVNSNSVNLDRNSEKKQKKKGCC